MVLKIARPDGSLGLPITLHDVLYIPNWHVNVLTHKSLFGPGALFEGGTFDEKIGVARNKRGKEVAWFTKCHDEDVWVLKQPEPAIAGTSRRHPGPPPALPPPALPPPALPPPVNPFDIQPEPQNATGLTNEKRRELSKTKNAGPRTLLPRKTGQSNLGSGATWHLGQATNDAAHSGTSGHKGLPKKPKPISPSLQNSVFKGKENIAPGAAPKEAATPAQGPSTPISSMASVGGFSMAAGDLDPEMKRTMRHVLLGFVQLSKKYVRLVATRQLTEEDVKIYYATLANVTDLAGLPKISADDDEDEDWDDDDSDEDDDEEKDQSEDDEEGTVPASSSVSDSDEVKTNPSPSGSVVTEVDDVGDSSSNFECDCVEEEGDDNIEDSPSAALMRVEGDSVEKSLSSSAFTHVEGDSGKESSSSSTLTHVEDNSVNPPLSPEDRRMATLIMQKGPDYLTKLKEDAARGHQQANRLMHILYRTYKEEAKKRYANAIEEKGILGAAMDVYERREAAGGKMSIFRQITTSEEPTVAATHNSSEQVVYLNKVAQLSAAAKNLNQISGEAAFNAAKREADKLLVETNELGARLRSQGNFPGQKPLQDKSTNQKATRPLPGRTAQANAAKAKAAASGSNNKQEEKLTPLEKAAKAKGAAILIHVNHSQAIANAARLAPTSLWDKETFFDARETAGAEIMGFYRKTTCSRHEAEIALVQGIRNQASEFRELYKDSELAKDYDALSDAEFANMLAQDFAARLMELGQVDADKKAAKEVLREFIHEKGTGLDEYGVTEELYKHKVRAEYLRRHELYAETDEGEQYATMTATADDIADMKGDEFKSRVKALRAQHPSMTVEEHASMVEAEFGMWCGNLAQQIRKELNKKYCNGGKKPIRLVCVEQLLRSAKVNKA